MHWNVWVNMKLLLYIKRETQWTKRFYFSNVPLLLLSSNYFKRSTHRIKSTCWWSLFKGGNCGPTYMKVKWKGWFRGTPITGDLPSPPPLPPTRTSHKLYLILSLLPSTIPPSRSLPSPHNPRQFYITGRQILCCQHSSRLPGIPPPPPPPPPPSPLPLQPHSSNKQYKSLLSPLPNPYLSHHSSILAPPNSIYTD